MIKFVSELRLKPVLVRTEKAIVGIVEDLIVNTDDGKLIGLLVREGFGKKHLKAVPEKDLLSITSEFYLISGYEAMGDIEEIVRIKNVLDRGIQIMGNKVYTVSGKYLGRCRDFTLNMKSLRMDKIYVVPPLLSMAMKEYVISYPQIVNIEKERIIVEDAFVKAGEAAKGYLADVAN